MARREGSASALNTSPRTPSLGKYPLACQAVPLASRRRRGCRFLQSECECEHRQVRREAQRQGWHCCLPDGDRENSNAAATTRSRLHRATSSPAAPAARQRSTPSQSQSRNSRVRLMPRASRTAISRRRSAARASSRFATFAQASASTSAPTANATPVMESVSDLAWSPRAWLASLTYVSSPGWRSTCRSISRRADSACAIVTPGARRPMTVTHCRSPSTARARLSGAPTVRSAARRRWRCPARRR